MYTIKKIQRLKNIIDSMYYIVIPFPQLFSYFIYSINVRMVDMH